MKYQFGIRFSLEFYILTVVDPLSIGPKFTKRVLKISLKDKTLTIFSEKYGHPVSMFKQNRSYQIISNPRRHFVVQNTYTCAFFWEIFNR